MCSIIQRSLVFCTVKRFSHNLCSKPVFPMKLPFSSHSWIRFSAFPDFSMAKLKNGIYFKTPCACTMDKSFDLYSVCWIIFVISIIKSSLESVTILTPRVLLDFAVLWLVIFTWVETKIEASFFALSRSQQVPRW